MGVWGQHERTPPGAEQSVTRPGDKQRRNYVCTVQKDAR